MLRPTARQVLVHGQVAAIGARAFDLLMALAERRERVVSKNELLELVWPGVVVEENNLQVHISALRKHLGAAVISTVPGRGYRFAATLLPAAGSTAAVDPSDSIAASMAPATPATPDALSQAAAELLFGREHDLQTLPYLLAAHRLVTIVGAGGIGKTALARAVAGQLQGRFTHGSVFIDLAPLAQPQALLPHMAGVLQQALQHAIGAGAAVATREALAQALQPVQVLLVLDNCEHLVQPVAELTAALLAQAPHLHVLATSQEPLRLPAEQVYRVSTLALPAGETLAEARAASAVRLFEDRARAADQRFVLDEGNVATVVAICRQLDGMALAIELAAARVPHLGLQGLHDRLGQRLRLLSGGSRETPPRQRTLGAALAWSHALLSAPEQAVLRRLAVMSGSFSPAGAQQVVADAALDEWAVLDHLGTLVDKSMVAVVTPVRVPLTETVRRPAAAASHESHEPHEPRLRLLETVRHFALERLAEAGEEAAVRERHLAHMLALAERARTGLTGPDEGAWLDRLDLDRDNLLAAHAWCDHAEDGSARGLRLISVLLRYWVNRGLLAQGHHACEQALARPGATTLGVLYGDALYVAGRISAYLGRDDEALLRLRASVAQARGCGANGLLVRSLTSLGSVCTSLGEHTAARPHREEALALARQAGNDTLLLTEAAVGLAELERLQGRHDAAQPLYEEALRHARAHGDRLATLAILANLSMLALARNAATPAATNADAHGDVGHSIEAGSTLTAVVRQRLLDALTIADELDSQRGRLTVLEVCAGLAATQAAWAQALMFDAAAERHIAAMGRRRDTTDLAFLTPLLQRAQAALGVADGVAARAAGRQLSCGDAVDQARRWLLDLGGAVPHRD